MATLPDARLYAFAEDQDWFFGVLHSRAHEIWSLEKASWHGKGNDPTYSVEACFETFAFALLTAEQQDRIGAAARTLDTLRARWLDPPEWTREEVLEFPATLGGPWGRIVTGADANGTGVARYTRLVPRDEDAALALRQRTLTDLYNGRPAWLQDAHRALDEAVFAAYGWDLAISDDEILARLLALNAPLAIR